MLSKDSIFSLLKEAVDLLGSVVVPASSLIVGARLYAYQFTVRKMQKMNPERHNQVVANSVFPSKTVLIQGKRQPVATLSSDQTQIGHSLKPKEIIVIVAARFVFLPMIGRILFFLSGAKDYVEDPLLQIYLLIPFCMPTASNSVVMAQMAAMNLPNSGARMENALLTIIFWQYVVSPIFLTANMALNLLLVFGADNNS